MTREHTPEGYDTCVIVDMDGTLVDVSGILHYVDGSLGYLPNGKPKRDFDAFHKASAYCGHNQQAIDYCAAAHAEGHLVVIVTARQQQYEQLSKVWLANTIPDEIDWAGPLMRPDHDYRPDAEVKLDIYRKIVALGLVVVGAIDDNVSIIELWESLGIPTVQVPRPPGDVSLTAQANRK